jgi:NitT/TauT family transport system substrate-binding protein
MDNVRGANEEAVSNFYDVAIQINMFPTTPAELLDVSGYQGLADLLYEGGEIDTQLTASEFVDTSYVERAAEMGCGTGAMGS